MRAHEHAAVREKQKPEQCSLSRKRAERALDGLAHPVDQRAKLGVTAVVVAELMRQHRPHLGNGHDLHQRQPHHHDAPPSALEDAGVHLRADVDLLGHGLADSTRHALELCEQPHLPGWVEARSRRRETRRARNDRDCDRARADQAEDQDAAGNVWNEHDPHEDRDQPDRQCVEADGQSHRQDRSAPQTHQPSLNDDGGPVISRGDGEKRKHRGDQSDPHSDPQRPVERPGDQRAGER